MPLSGKHRAMPLPTHDSARRKVRWNRTTGKFEPVGDPSSNQGGANPVVRQARVMFANNKYVCTCWTNDPTRTSCIHLMKYFTDCEDVGSHTVISSATVGLRTPLTLPLTSLVEVKYVREVKPHYAIPDEWMVVLREPIGINPVQVMLSRDDG